MELEGKIIQINPMQSGESRNGPWKKQEFIIETKSQYPKKVCVTVWNDKIDQLALKQNEELTLSIELESREYNGRWYTDVRAWKAERPSSQHYDTPEPDILPPSMEPPLDEAPPF